jgi:hypothetical protein
MRPTILPRSDGFRGVRRGSAGFCGVLRHPVAVGLYSVVSYGVATRTNEFGIRMALGARARDVVHLCCRIRRGMLVWGCWRVWCCGLRQRRLTVGDGELGRGYSPAAIEVLNGIRGLDLLAGRPEVDAGRLGVTGISGGGAMTWYIAAADERVKACSPACGTATLASHIYDRVIDGHCDCMWWINTAKWDLADFGMLIAPRPLLIASASQDGIFPIHAIREVHSQLQKLYRTLDVTETLQLVETPGGHSYHERSRTAIFSWFLETDTARMETEDTLRVYTAGSPASNRALTIQGELITLAPAPTLRLGGEPRGLAQADRREAPRRYLQPLSAHATSARHRRRVRARRRRGHTVRLHLGRGVAPARSPQESTERAGCRAGRRHPALTWRSPPHARKTMSPNVHRVRFLKFLDETLVACVDVDLFCGGHTLLHDPRKHRADDRSNSVVRSRSLHDRLGAHLLHIETGLLKHGREIETHMDVGTLALDSAPYLPMHALCTRCPRRRPVFALSFHRPCPPCCFRFSRSALRAISLGDRRVLLKRSLL